MKCTCCHQLITYLEYQKGYCTASPNSFHQVKTMHPAEAKLGAVGGE